MKTKIILTALMPAVLLSCNEPKVKHKHNFTYSPEKLKNIAIVNAEDPVCHMKTEGVLKDTAMYKNKIYGFCSTFCKDEFITSPEKYEKK